VAAADGLLQGLTRRTGARPWSLEAPSCCPYRPVTESMPMASWPRHQWARAGGSGWASLGASVGRCPSSPNAGGWPKPEASEELKDVAVSLLGGGGGWHSSVADEECRGATTRPVHGGCGEAPVSIAHRVRVT
jgi:hypothetical protein